MNTIAAAAQANVTADTVRAWARRGVIAATKTAGRWVIDATSLARRIAIAATKRNARKAAMTEPAPTTDRKTARAANKAAADAIRTRVRTALTEAGLPSLTGTEKQIAWALELRDARIDAAIHHLRGTHLGIHYSLTGTLTDDALRTSDIPGLRPWDTSSEYASEDDLLAALITAVTHSGAGNKRADRTQASWWIEQR